MKNRSKIYNVYSYLTLLAAVISLLLFSRHIFAQSIEADSNSIAVEVNYPSVVNAGGNFAVTASLQNNSSVPELVSVSWSLTPGAISGSHADSYRIFSYPLGEATSFFRMILEPGVPRIISLKEFFYEHTDLFDGELAIRETKVRVTATNWQVAEIAVEPMQIQVTHSGPAAPRMAQTLPPRLPLERRPIASSAGPWGLYDPNTGLEWLPLSRTHMQTLFSVMDKLEQGAEFEGFRVANLDEVKLLLLNAIHAAGIRYPSYALFAQYEYEDGDLLEGKALLSVAQELQQGLGITAVVRMPDHELDTASGILIGTSDAPNAVLEASISSSFHSQRGQFGLYPASELEVAGINSSAGVWLVRDGDL